MRFGSVCSGIEAASVAWHCLGWEAAWLSEVDVAASAVLAHRLGASAPVFPLPGSEKSISRIQWGDRLTNWGDMTRLPELILSGEAEAPDILCGGTPCQSFSVAGRREGLQDARGNLTLTFIEIADAIDIKRAENGDEPVICFWENVPGVLSDKTNAFGCLLAGLAGESDALEPPGGKWTDVGVVIGPQRTVAWIVKDAQYFGLAQRRKRVFLVASSREGFDPAAVLFEFDGLRRDSAPSRETWQEVAGTLDARTTGGGFPGSDGACANHVIPAESIRDAQSADTGRNSSLGSSGDSYLGLRARLLGRNSEDRLAAGHLEAPTWWDGSPVSQTLDAVLHKGQTMPEKNRFPAVLHPIPPEAYSIMPMNSGRDYKARLTDISQPLMAGGPTTGNQGGDFVLQPIPILEAGARTGVSTTDVRAGLGVGEAGDPMYSLQAGKQHAVAVSLRGRDGGGTIEMGDEIAGTLRASSGGGDKPHVLTHVIHGTQDPLTLDDLAFPLGRNSGQENVLAFSCKDYEADCTLNLAPTMRAMGHSESHANGGGQLAVLPFNTTQITSPDNGSNPQWGDPCFALARGNHPPAVCITGDITHTLKTEGFDASEDGTGRGQPIVVVDIYPTLRAGGNATGGHRPPGTDVDTCDGNVIVPAMAFQERGRGDGRSLEMNGDLAYALTAPNGGGRAQERNVLTPNMAVRRLMPVEAERLQGFPDGWSDVPIGSKRAADGPRYKQLGNSWAINPVRWIGSRIQQHVAGLIRTTIKVEPVMVSEAEIVWMTCP
jgi:DNA (cytosine-5)-methyltransferase 1